MRLTLIIAVMAAAAALAAGAPAAAQEGEAPAAAAEAGEARRLELARQYIGLMDLERMMREQMSGLVDMAAGLAAQQSTKGAAPSAPMERFVPEEQVGMMEEVTAMIIPLMTEVMVEAHARVFSEAELEALVGFFGSAAGRGILDKQVDLNLAVMEVMLERLPDWIAEFEGEWNGVAPDAALGDTGATKLYGT